jgi:hypothetical protein
VIRLLPPLGNGARAQLPMGSPMDFCEEVQAEGRRKWKAKTVRIVKESHKRASPVVFRQERIQKEMLASTYHNFLVDIMGASQ